MWYVRRYIIRNEVIRGKVELSGHKMREVRLKWSGHIKISCVNVSVKRCERLTIARVRKCRDRFEKKVEMDRKRKHNFRVQLE